VTGEGGKVCGRFGRCLFHDSGVSLSLDWRRCVINMRWGSCSVLLVELLFWVVFLVWVYGFGISPFLLIKLSD
jgi:hypothetical protein